MRYDRHGAIKVMLQEKYTDCSWNNVQDIAHDWLSYDRVFREVQNENKDVQTENHNLSKKVREQNYEINVLGKEVGFGRKLSTEEEYKLFG